jgi:hypothetical protein
MRYIRCENVYESAGVGVVTVDPATVEVRDEHRVGGLQENHVMWPVQVFSDENLGIFTIPVKLQDLPGRLAKIAGIDNVNIVRLAMRTGDPEHGA